MEKISTIIVGYNSKNYLSHCLRSVFEQRHWNGEIIYIDNASWDDSVGEVSRLFPDVCIVSLNENIGLAAANNLGISMSHGTFVCFLNPDVVLQPDYFVHLLETFDQNPHAAGCVGKLYRCTFGETEVMKSSVLDSAGHIMRKNRQVFDRGQGEEDRGQYDVREQVFSIVGAASVYRRDALENLKVGNEYFDVDFKHYKDDIDLGWRARLMGWELWYEPTAIAYHARGWKAGEEHTQKSGIFSRFREMSRSRKKVSDELKYHSFKNRHLMMVKNEQGSLFWRHILYILWYEIKALFYGLLRERVVVRGFVECIRLLPRARVKRKEIMVKKKVQVNDMVKWFQ
jgi:GT2 family glycosyltransferase